MDPYPGTSTLFEFDHAVFRAPEARFVLGTDGQPCMALKLGAYDAHVPISSLAKEFGLEGTPDSALLELVASGLNYVKVIRPGDSIPRELLDGTASWRVEEEHLETARGRLTLQIYSLLGGHERVVTDEIEIMQMVDDPAVKAKVRSGMPTIAERLGMDSSKVADIEALIERFARDFAYIVALRARANLIKQMMDKVAALRRIYRRDRTVDEELIRVNNLLQRPIGAFDRFFGEIDANTGEILGILRNIDHALGYVRESRDTLHLKLMKWDDLFVAWAEPPMEISSQAESLIKKLYQFLAQNFLVESSW